MSSKKRLRRLLNFQAARCGAFQGNEQCQTSKPCHIFSQSKNETQIFTINKPNIMKKSKYQQYFHCFIVCILIPYAFWFRYQQNKITVLVSTAFRSAFIRGRLLFQSGYPKVRRLLEGDAYLRLCTYQREYGICIKQHLSSHRRCSIKQVFLQISQNSQENTCSRASFLIRPATWPLTLAQVFSCEF